jgi:hypothetical protein
MVPEQVRMLWRREKSLVPAWDQIWFHCCQASTIGNIHTTLTVSWWWCQNTVPCLVSNPCTGSDKGNYGLAPCKSVYPSSSPLFSPTWGLKLVLWKRL